MRQYEFLTRESLHLKQVRMEDQSDKVTKKSEADKERLFATHNKLTGSIAVLPAVVVWI